VDRASHATTRAPAPTRAAGCPPTHAPARPPRPPATPILQAVPGTQAHNRARKCNAQISPTKAVALSLSASGERARRPRPQRATTLIVPPNPPKHSALLPSVHGLPGRRRHATTPTAVVVVATWATSAHRIRSVRLHSSAILSVVCVPIQLVAVLASWATSAH